MLGLGGYTSLIEPNQISVEEVRICLPRLPQAFEGLRVAQLSDLHYGPFTGDREINAAVDAVNSLAPDVAVLTGDYVTAPLYGTDVDPQRENVQRCVAILARISAPLGVFAALGNHDLAVDAYFTGEVLRKHGLKVVRNNSLSVERDGARLWIAGVDDVLYGKPDLDRTLADIPAGEAVILLAHEPDFADQVARYPVALQISGHSHGGQVRLPLLGALYLPPLARKYPWGLRQLGHLYLYTNRGIGTIGLPVRLGAVPEVTLFSLHCPHA